MGNEQGLISLPLRMDASCSPAHRTKHIPLLPYTFANIPFLLAQLDNGVSNGTTLWLGGQCLALYLAEYHTRYKSSGHAPRAIELGSGIGLTALSLSALGWNTVATDTPQVVASVLRQNIHHNRYLLPSGSGDIHIRELDWFVPPEQWLWNHSSVIASSTPPLSPSYQSNDNALIGPPWHLICTADTVYDSALVDPLLRSMHALSTLSAAAAPRSRPPSVLVCIERRDPDLVDRFLNQAKYKWNFTVERISDRKLAKIIQKRYPHWGKEEREGVELWKLRLNANPTVTDGT